jgi:membrane-associated phospholipid phosphatase
MLPLASLPRPITPTGRTSCDSFHLSPQQLARRSLSSDFRRSAIEARPGPWVWSSPLDQPASEDIQFEMPPESMPQPSAGSIAWDAPTDPLDARAGGTSAEEPPASGNVFSYVAPRWDYAPELRESIVQDYVNFYATDNLLALGAAFGVGAAVANTSADARLYDALHENLTRTPSDEYAEYLHGHRFLGDGFYLLPFYATLAIAGNGLGDEPLVPVVGDWGERSFRAILVGAPPLLATQYITGGSRPGEQPWASNWQPFQDVNGVSGHAFMGAVPFISAAKMSDHLLWKAAFYTASLVPGMSRITDHAHYPSQVFLGWMLAYVAATAVDQTDRGTHDAHFFPWVEPDAVGVGVEVIH